MISLPFMAWIGVVIIQAVTHFVIIGRRSKKQQLLLEGESGMKYDAVDATNSSHENTDSSVQIIKYDSDEYVEGRGDNEHEALDSPDECDFINDEQQRIRSLSKMLPVLEPRNSHLRTKRFEALDTGTRVEMERVSAIHDVDSYFSGVYGQNEDIKTGRNIIDTSLSEAQKSHCDYDDINDLDSYCGNDDCDSDCDNIDDDEQWRYELVIQYYAPSAESILTIASRSNLEPDDERLKPGETVEDNTIIFFEESLERRQSILLNSHVNNLDDVDGRLTFPSSTAPVHATPSISCA